MARSTSQKLAWCGSKVAAGQKNWAPPAPEEESTAKLRGGVKVSGGERLVEFAPDCTVPAPEVLDEATTP